MMFPVKNPEGCTFATEADQASHSHAACVVFRHEGYDGPILGDG
jgi:hypothetical protein